MDTLKDLVSVLLSTFILASTQGKNRIPVSTRVVARRLVIPVAWHDIDVLTPGNVRINAKILLAKRPLLAVPL